MVKGPRSTDAKVEILLVDDDAAYLEVLAAYLAKWYAVWTARSIEEASGLLEYCRPDLMVLDLELQRASGLDLAMRLQQEQSACASVPILVLSARRLFPDVERALTSATQIRAFLQKPCELPLIRETIAQALPCAAIPLARGGAACPA